jgi:hypothetical protein
MLCLDSAQGETMQTKTLLVSGLFACVLGGVAHADTPPRTTILTGHAKDVQTLLDETQAARAAIARGEQRAARELVGDALALDHQLAKQHRYAELASGRGTFESITSHDRSPVVDAYDKFSDRELLDLQATGRDLVEARMALVAHRAADADRALANVERAIVLDEKRTPERDKLAIENLRLALREAEAGNWHAAKVALDAVAKDVAQAIKTTTPPPPTKQPAPGKAAAARR